jgi:hypothetical protein
MFISCEELEGQVPVVTRSWEKKEGDETIAVGILCQASVIRSRIGSALRYISVGIKPCSNTRIVESR